MTRRCVDAAGDGVRIRDTRKTLPGLRALQRAAVRAGGGFNHRDSLSDAVLIKDNHLAGRAIPLAIQRARSRWPGRVVEVECDTLEQVQEARDAGADIVLLDNMDDAAMAEAVRRASGRVLLEASGNMTLERLPKVAATGVDFVSMGALTHSAKAVDISFEITG